MGQTLLGRGGKEMKVGVAGGEGEAFRRRSRHEQRHTGGMNMERGNRNKR